MDRPIPFPLLGRTRVANFGQNGRTELFLQKLISRGICRMRDKVQIQTIRKCIPAIEEPFLDRFFLDNASSRELFSLNSIRSRSR